MIGCDGAESSSPPPALMAMADLPIPSRVILERLATLAPGRSTQVVATSKSLYVLQSDAGPNGALIEVVNGQAVPTALTSDTIAKSMSLPKARGQITSIAADGDRVAFCYAGVNGQKPLAAVGTFNPANGEIFTTVDTFSLERVDPEFITSSVRPYLFIEGDTAWLVRVEKAALRIITIRKIRALQPEVSAKQIDLGAIQDAITRSAWDFSPAAKPGTFYLTDTASRWIRLFDANGAVHHVARFDESLASISPAALDASGRVLVLASDRDGVNNKLLIQNGEAFKALPASTFEAANVDLASLRIERLTPLPGKPNRFIAYDGTSGTLLGVSLQ
jgi:hypothetical protein